MRRRLIARSGFGPLSIERTILQLTFAGRWFRRRCPAHAGVLLALTDAGSASPFSGILAASLSLAAAITPTFAFPLKTAGTAPGLPTAMTLCVQLLDDTLLIYLFWTNGPPRIFGSLTCRVDRFG
jgi:hypothetical protein